MESVDKNKVYLSYRHRCVMNVGTAVADEILSNHSQVNLDSHSQHRIQKPVLICIRGKVPVCCFEGGINVQVNLVNRCLYDEGLRQKGRGLQNWVVTHCNVRFYPRIEDGSLDPQKEHEAWDTDRMKALWQKRYWQFPEVMSFAELTAKYPDFSPDHWQ